MNVPKSIYKCLLSLGYRPARSKNYCKFLPDKPVAQWVEFNDQERWCDETDAYEQFFLLDLSICVPRSDGGFTSPNYGWVLCPDGTMQRSSGSTLYLHIQGFRENEDAQAVEVMRANLDRCMAELLDYDYWLALIDFETGVSSALPAKYAHLQNDYTKLVLPKGYPINLSPFSETYQQIQEIEKNDALMQQIKDFVNGKTDTLPAELEYAAFHYESWHCKKIRRFEIYGFYLTIVSDKCYYLMLAERYDELRQFVEQFPFPEKGGYGSDYERAKYRYLLACAEQRKIIVTDESREWAEKKKLVAPNTWESVPESAFADPDADKQETTATMADNIYAIFFSGGKKALAKYLLTRHGVDINTLQGEKVPDALDEAENLDANQFVVRSPRGRWCVLMGSIDHCLDDSLGDIGKQLSAVSEKGEVLLLTSNDTSGGLWFEYHKNGKLKRRWICACGEVEHNDGKPLNDFDAKTFGTEIDEEEGTPETDVLVELAEQITGMSWDALAAAGVVYRLPDAGANK